MKFKIVQIGNVFQVKRKVLFFYVTEHQELGWNCSVPHEFQTLQKAREYIIEAMQKEVEVAYDIQDLHEVTLNLKEVL